MVMFYRRGSDGVLRVGVGGVKSVMVRGGGWGFKGGVGGKQARAEDHLNNRRPCS